MHSTSSTSRCNVRAAFALGLAGTALAYLGALKGPHLHDDYANLGPLLAPFSDLSGFLDLVLSNASGMLRRPISNASFLLNFKLFGDSAFAFKTVNLALHLLTGLLLFRLFHDVLTRLAKPEAQRLAAIAAIVWCAHPLLLSTVAYTVQRMTILSALFSILAVTSFLRALPPDATTTRTPAAWTPIAGFFLWSACALLSKENGALTPVLAAALWLAMPRTQALSKSGRIAATICIAAPVLAGLVIACWAGPNLISYSGRDFTLVERLSTQAVVLWEYIGLLLFPNPAWMGLFWDAHPIFQPRSPIVVLAVVGWLAACTLAWRTRTRLPMLLLGTTWFLAGHVMESSVLPLEMAYEHRNYLPSMFVALAATAAIAGVSKRLSLRANSLELPLISALVLLTAIRSTHWSSTQNFAAHEFSRAPTSLRANNAMLSRAIDERNASAALHFEQRTEALSNNAAWALSGRILLKCFGIDAPFNLDTLSKKAIEEVNDTKLMRVHQGVVKLLLLGNCDSLDRTDYIKHLTEIAEAADRAGLSMQASEYHYQLASMAWFANEPAIAREHLLASLAANPTALTPIDRLILLDIQTQSFEAAATNIARFNRIARSSSPWKLHRVNYWCERLEEAAIATNRNLDRTEYQKAGCKITGTRAE